MLCTLLRRRVWILWGRFCKINGRRLFSSSFFLILFTFQTDFAFYSYCLSSQNLLASCSKSQLAATKEALQAFLIYRLLSHQLQASSWRPVREPSEKHLTTAGCPCVITRDILLLHGFPEAICLPWLRDACGEKALGTVHATVSFFINSRGD